MSMDKKQSVQLFLVSAYGYEFMTPVFGTNRKGKAEQHRQKLTKELMEMDPAQRGIINGYVMTQVPCHLYRADKGGSI